MRHSGYVYLWYDRKKKWFCVGSHFGQVSDDYVTSTGFMMRAYKKRPEDFKLRILDYYDGEDPKELLALEQRWLDLVKIEELCIAENKRNGTVRYYNQKKTASGLNGELASKIRGEYWQSEKGQEHKRRLSERMRVDNPSKPGREAWNTGKKCPSISEGRKGKGKGRPAWNTGKKCPSISEGRLANPIVYTEELRKRIGDSQRGRKRTEETKMKQSAALKGKPKSDESRLAMSIAAKERSKRIRACPYCNHVGSGPTMSRWHFSNCKFA